MDEATCPSSWRAWPTVHLGEFTNKNVKELLQAELALCGQIVSPDNEHKILTYSRTPQTANPLYVVIIASDLAHCNSNEKMAERINLLLQPNVVELYKTLIHHGRHEFEDCDVSESLIVRVLQLIYASRNGVSEAELFEILPELSWNFWAPIMDAFKDRHILSFR